MTVFTHPPVPGSSVSYLEIETWQAGQRIDNFLLTRLKGVPKSHVYRMLRTGEVRVNKGRVRQTYRLRAGDVLRIPPLKRDTSNPDSQPSADFLAQLAKTIVYEDEGLLILDKPAGIAVHAGSGVRFGVIEGLRALRPQTPGLELVHRLDRETSGCLMLAKNPDMLRYLHELLRAKAVFKYYLALVKGRWPADRSAVEAPLRKNTPRSGERIVRVDASGKSALSYFTLKQNFDQGSLVEVYPVTGRTHQIRVHAQYAGHPLGGDEKYGDRVFNRQLRELGLQRLFLHASRLRIDAPDLKLRISAPLPDTLQQVLACLEP